MTRRIPIALATAAFALSAHAQQRRTPDPPIRQPTLIQPVPDAASRAQPRPAPPAVPTRRPPTPLEGQQKFYDPHGPGYASLQKAHEALAGFPVDPAGFVDWVASVAAGRIEPGPGLSGPGSERSAAPDVILRNTKEMPPVRFPHAPHAALLGCDSCHPVPFAERAGAATITMERIFRGEACGMCHGKVAFPAWANCERCHAVARAPGEPLYGGERSASGAGPEGHRR